MIKTPITILAALFVLTFLLQNASADSVTVQMLDHDYSSIDGQPDVFRPAIVTVSPGDKVKFVPTDFGHDLQSIQTMRPDGAEPFSAPKNAGATVTFQKEGVHVYQCESHKTMGMIGVVVVGNPSVNLADVRQMARTSNRLSENGKERLTRILDTVQRKFAPR